MKRNAAVSACLLVVLLALYGAYVAGPLKALMTEAVRGGTPVLQSLFAGGNMEAILNSVVVSLFTVVGGALVGGLLAFCVTQFEFPFRRIVSLMAVLPVALPPLVGVIAFLLVFSDVGIIPGVLRAWTGLSTSRFALDGIPAILAVHVYSFNAYFFLFLFTALKKIDASVVEAAEGLGASPYRVFVAAVLPELRPALIGASLLAFMGSMASFSAPLLFAGSHRFITLQIFSAKVNGEMGVASAHAVLVSVLALLFFVVLHFSSRNEIGLRRTKGADRPARMRIGAVGRRLFLGLSALLLFVEALPLLVILLMAFAREGSWAHGLIPTACSLGNFVTLFTTEGGMEPVKNSLMMTLAAAGIALVIGVAAAFVLSNLRSNRWKTTTDILFTLPYAVPGTVLALAFILYYGTPSILTGGEILVGTFWILPMAYVVRSYPLVLRSTSAALAAVDGSLLEAAASCGAGAGRQFTQILLPLVRPGIAGGLLLAFVTLVGEFVSSVLLYTYDNRPVSVEVLAQLRAYNLGVAAAYCVVLLLLILAATALVNRLQRRWG